MRSGCLRLSLLSPQIIAAQRSNNIAPQIASSTTTIFQCFLSKRLVGIPVSCISLVRDNGSVTKGTGIKGFFCYYSRRVALYT